MEEQKSTIILINSKPFTVPADAKPVMDSNEQVRGISTKDASFDFTQEGRKLLGQSKRNTGALTTINK